MGGGELDPDLSLLCAMNHAEVICCPEKMGVDWTVFFDLMVVSLLSSPKASGLVLVLPIHCMNPI